MPIHRTLEQLREDWAASAWTSPTPGLVCRRPPGGRLYPEARIYDCEDGVILECTAWPAGRKSEKRRRLWSDTEPSVELAQRRAEEFMREVLG